MSKRGALAALFLVTFVGGGAYEYQRIQDRHGLVGWQPPVDDVRAWMDRVKRFRVEDPLEPGRPARALEHPSETIAGIAGPKPKNDEWVWKRPDHAFAHERPPQDRGGLNPCAMPDTGDRGLTPWISVGGRGRISIPKNGSALRSDGTFDVILHFHGHDIARQSFAKADVPIAFFGTTFKDYRGRLAGPGALAHLVEAVEEGISKEAGHPAKARHIALAAWSGGYDAISILLEQSDPDPRVDAVVLLDGLHSSRQPEKLEAQMGPFVGFGQRAVKGEVFFFVEHSSIDTDSYASTTETMHFLASRLGGRPLSVLREDPLGMQLIEMFDVGGFHLRGYAGGGKMDHCASLSLYPMVARALAKRWKS